MNDMEGNYPCRGLASSEANWWQTDFLDKIQSISLSTPEESSAEQSLGHGEGNYVCPAWTASQMLWFSGFFTGTIPDGFYSIIPDQKLKELFSDIPSCDDLRSHGLEGRAEVILVDCEKDKKLSMLKQLCAALVKGLNSNPPLLIKKIAGLVFDFYKRPNTEQGPAKSSCEDSYSFIDNKGSQLLGQIKHGSCRPRAILFKVLADSVGLESKLVVGLPDGASSEFADSYKHMSVIVILNSMELLVDLMRFPGQLIPFSPKAIFISHISASGESDSAEYDSCDSPLGPNSPLRGFSDKVEADNSEQEDNVQTLYQRRPETCSNLSGQSLRNVMLRSKTFSAGKLSISHSESDIANAFWRQSQRRCVAEELAASSSSPEHPLNRTRERSILGGVKQSSKQLTEHSTASKSDASSSTSTSNVKRIRRRSISITPEIGDDIVKAVRAMNDTLKQHRLQRDHVIHNSCSHSSESQNNLSNDQISDGLVNGNDGSWNKEISNPKAMSLPSSPHEFRVQPSDRTENYDFLAKEKMAMAWKTVLQSSSFLNKPILPFEEWDIDFSELTIGTRIGIGFFGEVFRGIWNGTDVAIKVFLEQDLTTENMEDFCNEIFILSRLRHPNVILFLGACMKPPHLSMVTEYMELGSLYYLIHMSGQKKKLSWRRRLKILRDICRGLMCIHRMQIIHRDLKSANCLVNKHWTVKICDFGLSQVMSNSPLSDSSSAGTPEWMAPELIRNEPFTEKCDIFSLGVIMWELSTLRKPWEGVPSVQVVYSVANEGLRLEIPEGPLSKLISDCFADPQDRPNCQEILTRLLDCEYALS